jgi:hypothetical protein
MSWRGVAEKREDVKMEGEESEMYMRVKNSNDDERCSYAKTRTWVDHAFHLVNFF